MPDIHLPPSMIGQGVYMKSSCPSPAPAPPLINPCNTAITSEVLAFCSSSCDIATTSTPAPLLPPPASGEPRRVAKAPHPTHILKCPRCASSDTKFCYYNNYNLSQPRYFCKNCKRYWTAGGVLRNVPIGGGLRKNKRSKLKLAAEAEAAAAAAARDLCTQQQLHDGKPPNSPVQVASASAMGSSITCANSSVVSGVPVNFAGGTPPSFLPSHTHLPRTSSGSDCSTIDYAGNESCAASAGSGQQQNSSQLQNFYRGAAVVGVRPQLYASYGAPASLASSCNQQYSGMSSREEGARSSYIHAGGYDGSCSQSLIGMEEVAGSNRDNGNVSSSHSVMSMGNGNHGSVNKGEKEEIITSNSNYDWQFISENLFNGEGLLGGSSWPDFSQCHAWMKNINT